MGLSIIGYYKNINIDFKCLIQFKFIIVLVNPRKLKKSRQAYQGNCYQCYEFFTVCLVGN